MVPQSVQCVRNKTYCIHKNHQKSTYTTKDESSSTLHPAPSASVTRRSRHAASGRSGPGSAAPTLSRRGTVAANPAPTVRLLARLPNIAMDCQDAIQEPAATPAPWLAANQPPATGPAGVKPMARRNVGRTAAPAIPPIMVALPRPPSWSGDSQARVVAVQERRITRALTSQRCRASISGRWPQPQPLIAAISARSSRTQKSSLTQ